MQDKDFLFDYLSAKGPSGFEEPAQRVWVDYVKKFSSSIDGSVYGSAWGILDNSAKKKVLLEAHVDEIGFIVRHIDSKGFIRIDRIGGIDIGIAKARELIFFGDKGEVEGIIGNTAIHIQDKSDSSNNKVEKLFVDIGAKNAKEVEKTGIRVGTHAIYKSEAWEFGKKYICGRALDNRMGGYIIAQVLKNLSKEKLDFGFYALNSVQEEIGGFGAKMATSKINPNLAIVLDVTHATDTPDINHNLHGDIKLGKGPTVSHGSCNHPRICKQLMEISQKQKIKIQHEASSKFSGTDTDTIYHQGNGIPSALISLPLRYMHSVVEMASKNDVQQTIDLLTQYVLSLKEDDFFDNEL